MVEGGRPVDFVYPGAGHGATALPLALENPVLSAEFPQDVTATVTGAVYVRDIGESKQAEEAFDLAREPVGPAGNEDWWAEERFSHRPRPPVRLRWRRVPVPAAGS